MYWPAMVTQSYMEKYKSHPVMWDIQDKGHKAKNKNAVAELVKLFKCSDSEIAKQISSMSLQHQHSGAMKQPGSSYADVYLPKRFGNTKHTFFSPGLKSKEGTTSMNYENNKIAYEGMDDGGNMNVARDSANDSGPPMKKTEVDNSFIDKKGDYLQKIIMSHSNTDDPVKGKAMQDKGSILSIRCIELETPNTEASGNRVECCFGIMKDDLSHSIANNNITTTLYEEQMSYDPNASKFG